MTGSSILDTAIGIVLVFAIFSTLVSRINESIANLLKLRFNMLLRGLEHMLAVDKPADATAPTGLLDVTGLHALLKREPATSGYPTLTARDVLNSSAVSRSVSDTPSYLSPNTFALGLLEVLERGGTVDTWLGTVNATVGSIPQSGLKDMLQQFVTKAEGDRTKFIAELEQWYQATMDRVSGLYKRMIQWVVIIITVFVVGICNVDAIHLTETLYRNPAVRQIAVQQAATTSPKLCPAEAAGTAAGTVPASQSASCLVKKSQDLQLPLFWGKGNDPGASGGWLLKILGLLVSVLALSFGATFWFDLLGNLVNLRNAGGKPSPPPPTAPTNVAVTVTAQPAQAVPAPGAGAQSGAPPGDAQP